MRIAGIVLTSVASALLLSGIICQAALPNSGGVSLVVSLSQIGTSTVIAAIGVPLWVSGAKPPEIAPGVSIGPASLRIAF
ncbi:Hypothetical protein A7982_08035 [Minicystis rosea]|nr:Hypothetical protein A7982_08035 [Minicystis rosea]